MNTSKLVFVVILLVACLSQFASDIYSPSLPAISIALSAPLNIVQLSMAIYMFGVAMSLLIYGSVSEGVGRKSPLLVGVSIMTIGSLLCLIAPNIEVLLLGRLIQGLGAGAGAGLWRAIFRDVYTGEQLAKYGSYLSIVVTFIIPAAPAVGGYLQHYIGWRAIFGFITLYTLAVILTVTLYYKETSHHHHRDRLRLSFVYTQYKQLLTNRIFIGTTLCTFFSYGAFFAWFTVGPVLLIHLVGISPVAFVLSDTYLCRLTTVRVAA